jgi:hypothetical protein
MENIKFTYLIGAGASANTIPVINNFAKELGNFALYIENFEIKEDIIQNIYRINDKPSEIKERFVKEIKWLAKKCAEHLSIDTFAKKLFLSNRYKELNILKVIVSEFLLVQQIRYGIDKRYDAFFASILEKENGNLMLPDNIKILSWNYDKQIEYSINQFYKNPDYNLVENFVQVVPRKDGVNVDTNKFCLFKLNGTIGGTIRNNEEYVPMAIDYSLIKDKVTNEINQNIITNMMERFYFVEQKNLHYEYYKTRQQDEYPTITYSWEKNPVFEQIRKEALKATKDTRILVIIGYSFPTFNRILDKKILQNMGYIPKVFIQSPSSSIEGVMQRFKALYEFEQESEIIPIVNVDEFYIPFEY